MIVVHMESLIQIYSNKYTRLTNLNKNKHSRYLIFLLYLPLFMLTPNNNPMLFNNYQYLDIPYQCYLMQLHNQYCFYLIFFALFINSCHTLIMLYQSFSSCRIRFPYFLMLLHIICSIFR